MQNVEIRAVAFNEAAKKLHPAVEKGKVYTFTCGKVVVPSEEYRTTHPYEIHFNSSTVITEDPSASPTQEETDSHNEPRAGDIPFCCLA